MADDATHDEDDRTRLATPLVDPDQGWIVDDEAQMVAGEAGGDPGDLSPEEAALHVSSEDEALGLNWDDSPGYVEG